MMRFFVAAALVLSCSLCFAEDLPKDYGEIKSLTVAQASYLAAKNRYGLVLKSLTSMDKDVAHELAKERKRLTLSGLTSIDKDVAHELGNSKDLILYGLTSIDKNVAEGLAKCVGTLNLNGLTSIDKGVAQELGKHKGNLYVNHIISIDRDVAQELAKCTGWLNLSGLTSIDKNVAQELVKFKGAHIRLSSKALIDKEALEILKLNSKIGIPKKYRDLIRDQQPDEKSPDVGGSVYVENPFAFFVGKTLTTKIKNAAIGSDRATHILTIKFADASSLQGNRLPVYINLEPPHPCLPNGFTFNALIKRIDNAIHAGGGFQAGSARLWGKKSGITMGILVILNEPEKYQGQLRIDYWPLEGGTNMKLNFTGVGHEFVVD